MPLQSFTCNSKHVAAHISVGGWDGSRWFSSNVATPENRTAFVQSVTDFVQQYDLDGINFECVVQLPPLEEYILSDHLSAGNIPTSRA